MARILLADDDERIRRGFAAKLKNDGHDVSTANNGREALALAGEFHPEVVISDMRMPELDGLGLFRSLPEGDGFFPGKIIFTAFDDDEALKFAVSGDNGVYRVEKDRWETDLPVAIARSLELRRARLDAYETGKRAATLEAEAKFQAERGTYFSEVEHDLKTAREIQARYFLPKAETGDIFANAGVEVSVHADSVGIVSGDFYFPKRAGLHRAGLFLADVCGHGVSAALISVRILSRIEQARSPRRHPSEFIEDIHEDIAGLVPETRFVAVLYLLCGRDRDFSLSNAGQPSPMLWRDGSVATLSNSNQPIGQIRPRGPCAELKGEWSRGDRMLIFSDGIVEAADERDRGYGEDRLRDAFLNANQQGLEGRKIVDAVLGDFRNFLGKKSAEDDVTLILLEKKG
ncbi:MAG: fused response regulator/phosphatase [Nitrospinae bacterium]|nr:fused response regulator/phosphatase [Nitrospinota bacterium]